MFLTIALRRWRIIARIITPIVLLFILLITLSFLLSYFGRPDYREQLKEKPLRVEIIGNNSVDKKM